MVWLTQTLIEASPGLRGSVSVAGRGHWQRDGMSGRCGRGFSLQDIQHMRLFYLPYPPGHIPRTPSGKLPLPLQQRV